MRSTHKILMASWLVIGAVAASARASSGADAAGTAAASAERKNVQASATGAAQVSAAGVAREARAEARARAEAIRSRAEKVSQSAKERAEAKLESQAERVEGAARTEGEARVAARLAGELEVSADALIAERAEIGAGWGELTIAHTLAANAANATDVEDLFQLHAEGMGWGAIAAGLGLRLGDAVRAVRSEAEVATGLRSADGRVAVIGTEGSKVDVAARASGHPAVEHGASAGVSSSVSAGAAAGAAIPRVRIK